MNEPNSSFAHPTTFDAKVMSATVQFRTALADIGQFAISKIA